MMLITWDLSLSNLMPVRVGKSWTLRTWILKCHSALILHMPGAVLSYMTASSKWWFGRCGKLECPQTLSAHSSSTLSVHVLPPPAYLTIFFQALLCDPFPKHSGNETMSFLFYRFVRRDQMGGWWKQGSSAFSPTTSGEVAHVASCFLAGAGYWDPWSLVLACNGLATISGDRSAWVYIPVPSVG